MIFIQGKSAKPTNSLPNYEVVRRFAIVDSPKDIGQSLSDPKINLSQCIQRGHLAQKIRFVLLVI